MPKYYYLVLGISRGPDLDKIKRAHRRVVNKHHPDVSALQEDSEKFREIREAYETLGDEAKRRRYDEELARQGSEVRITHVPEIIESRRSQLDEIDRFFSRTDEFFEGFLPGFFDIEKGRIRAKDLYFEATLSPREATEGVLFPVTVPVVEPCPRCRKAGLWEGFFCPVCFGHGRVQSEREFSLSVPPNVKNGLEIRLSPEDIGLRNVYLNVRVRIDPFIEEEDW